MHCYMRSTGQFYFHLIIDQIYSIIPRISHFCFLIKKTFIILSALSGKRHHQYITGIRYSRTIQTCLRKSPHQRIFIIIPTAILPGKISGLWPRLYHSKRTGCIGKCVSGICRTNKRIYIL